MPKAIVVSRPGHEVSEAEILEYCRNNLAKIKLPKSVDFLEELPRNPIGEVLRRILKDKYWQGYDVRIS